MRRPRCHVSVRVRIRTGRWEFNRRDKKGIKIGLNLCVQILPQYCEYCVKPPFVWGFFGGFFSLFFFPVHQLLFQSSLTLWHVCEIVKGSPGHIRLHITPQILHNIWLYAVFSPSQNADHSSSPFVRFSFCVCMLGALVGWLVVLLLKGVIFQQGLFQNRPIHEFFCRKSSPCPR